MKISNWVLCNRAKHHVFYGSICRKEVELVKLKIDIKLFEMGFHITKIGV